MWLALAYPSWLPFADQPAPLLSLMLAGIAVIIIGIAKSGFGGGVGIVAVPLFIMALNSPQKGIGTLLLLLIAADIFSVYHHWRKWDTEQLGKLMPGSIAGIVIGSVLLAYFTADASASQAAKDHQDSANAILLTIVGIIALLYPIFDWVKARYAPQWRIRGNWLNASITGTGAGVVSTLAHAAGPVASVYLLGQHMEKSRFIGTSVIYFFIVNSLKVAPYLLLGLIDTKTFYIQLWLLPLIPLGTFTGAFLNRIMQEQVFRQIILAIIFITGVNFIGKTTGLNDFIQSNLGY